MKTAVKVLSIVGLVIGILWAFVGFFGVWFGGAVDASFQASDSESQAIIESTSETMIKLMGSFVVTLIAGILGIVGSDKKTAHVKPMVLGGLTFICGILLFPLASYVAALLFVVAGFLLILSGAFAKPSNTNAFVE